MVAHKTNLYHEKLQQPVGTDEYSNFDQYSDPSDNNVMSMEGLVKFFADLQIDGESIDSLYLLYIMDTEELNVIKVSHCGRGISAIVNATSLSRLD